MSLKCKLGLHTWDGCKCSECGKVRDEQHKWNGCKCEICGKTRDEEHDWGKNCNMCSICGMSRDMQHTWRGCKCAKCEEIRDENHNWKSDCEKCSRCGKDRENIHKWNSCLCKNCEQTKHIWDGLKCKICGDTHTHIWNKDFKYCVLCNTKSGFSKAIIKYEFLQLILDGINRESRISNDKSFLLLALPIIINDCKFLIKINIKEKYGYDIDYWDNDENGESFSSYIKSNINKFEEIFNEIKNEALKDLEQIELEKCLSSSSNSDSHSKFIYFEQDRPFGYALCSWDPCPCGSFGTTLTKGQGYLYIPESAVEFRKDCLTKNEFQSKLQLMASKLPKGTDLVFTDVPVLVCDQGIKELDIDPKVAHEDAKHWWDTGLIPLRPSPKRQ